MKLSIALLLTLALATGYIVKAQEDVDAEVLDEEDDDAIIEDEDEVEDEDDEVEAPAAEEAEEQPQLMPMPLSGVRSFVHFPDGAMSITGGKVSEIVVGVQNNGETDIEMVSCNGKMHYPNQAGEVVQNFTNVGYEKQAISSKSEASFYYAFMPNIYSGGREFIIAIELYYKEKNSNLYYRAVPFNQTVNILESAEGVATEIFFMYSTVFFLVLVGAWFFYNRVVVKKLGLAKPASKKVETGTSNEGVNMDWISESHKELRKRSVKQKSN